MFVLKAYESKVNTECLFNDFPCLFPQCRYEVELEGLKDEYAKTLEDAKKEKVSLTSPLIYVIVEILASRRLTDCIYSCRLCWLLS